MICFETEIKVRTYECDLYGHVNNAAFLNYCEFARVEFLNELGFTLESLKEKGFLLPVVKIEIEYKRPAFPGDQLLLTLEWLKKGRSSSQFRQEIFNKITGELITQILVTWVVTNLKGTPISIPDELSQRYQQKYGRLPGEES